MNPNSSKQISMSVIYNNNKFWIAYYFRVVSWRNERYASVLVCDNSLSPLAIIIHLTQGSPLLLKIFRRLNYIHKIMKDYYFTRKTRKFYSLAKIIYIYRSITKQVKIACFPLAWDLWRPCKLVECGWRDYGKNESPIWLRIDLFQVVSLD